MSPSRLPLLALAASLSLSCSHTRSDDDPLTATALPIIGGVEDDDALAHESVVLLAVGDGACSGSLIAPNLILTARHCVSHTIVNGISCDPYGDSGNGNHVGDDYAPADIRVFTGFAPDFFFGEPVTVGKQLFHHPEKILCDRDIALVLLESDVPGITPMPVRLGSPAVIGELTMAIGYGLTHPNNYGSSGRRFRRGDIPVLTSGRDLNYWSGANELQLGQSTCQGDSGGPVIAMATGAILGVTSRGGDCISDTQIFSRTDAHKALIEQALAAAGHAAVLEPGTPPQPEARKAVGAGPCTAGSQCKNDLCLGTAANSYCSKLCYPQSCPTGMICIDTSIPVGDQSLEAFACRPIPDGTDCEDCRYDKCQDAFETCIQNEVCATAIHCADGCKDDACRTKCRDKASSNENYANFENCVCGSTCGSSCVGQCGAGAALDAGAGGAAGAAGNGGSGGVAGQGGAADKGGSGGEGGGSGDAGDAGSGEPPTEAPASGGDDGGCSIAASSNGTGAEPSALLSLSALLGLGWMRRRRIRTPRSRTV